jgi:hypothetical protein
MISPPAVPFGSGPAVRGEDAWYDEEAGPIVRLYAMTGGRVSAAGTDFAVSMLVRRTGDPAADAGLSAEKSAILRLCTRALSVAEIAAYLSLPLGTVAALLGDLRDAGLIRTQPRSAREHLPMEVMQRLHDGLLAL